MTADDDRWKIRFGQIFQALLAESGQRIEDHLYFIPAGQELDYNSEKSYDLIRLHAQNIYYKKYFSVKIPEFQNLSSETVRRLNAAIVMIPGFGHHLISQRAFGEQISLLEGMGFKVLYAWYEDSFESTAKCAKRVYDIIRRELNGNQDLIFLTYSKGSPIVVELLADTQYKDVAERTKAVVSIAGALRGTPLASSASSRATLRLLKAFRRLSKGKSIIQKIVKGSVKLLSKFRIKFFKEWLELLDKVEEFADDLMDLPEGIIDMMRVTVKSKHSHIRLPLSIKLFSISAVYPRKEFERGLQFISNPDDLFLYISGSELYQYNVFNDTQLLLPDSQFFPGIGVIVELGVVKADHWGIALPNVYSRTYIDPFPRIEMIKAVLIVLDEFFTQEV
jgi:hypothetical protein